MREEWLYDITDFEKALESLSKLLNIKECNIFKFLMFNATSYLDCEQLYRDMIKEFNIDLEKIDLDIIEIKSIHVTTGCDDGKSILNNGLLNLRETIKRDTPMRRFLIDKGIEIDFENRIIKYKGKELEIVDNSKNSWSENDFVYHKLYKDYLINGFHCDEDPIKYGGNVAHRPEFIGSLGKFINNTNLQYEWASKFEQCYIVEYKATPYTYEWFNYSSDGMSEESFNEDKQYHIKKWLIIQAILVIANKILRHSKPKIFSYLRFDENIPKEDIIKVINVTSERNKG
ncbi:hypothetical protein JCM1393_27650 [Clostridium carnis]